MSDGPLQSVDCGGFVMSTNLRATCVVDMVWGARSAHHCQRSDSELAGTHRADDDGRNA